mmetsp:Transcript_10190/g.23606  ORF Transcript_10190/g.23606 Transcript_10190/m.23606 type:complete len:92 (+) Transcript_10190:243-518(+)
MEFLFVGPEMTRSGVGEKEWLTTQEKCPYVLENFLREAARRREREPLFVTTMFRCHEYSMSRESVWMQTRLPQRCCNPITASRDWILVTTE